MPHILLRRLPGHLRPMALSAFQSHFHTSAFWFKPLVKDFKLADIGEGITECQVVAWHVKPGAFVEEFDPLVEVMSDKATVEITSPYGGKITSLAGGEGDIVKVGSVLCQVEVEVDDGLSEEPTTEQPPKATIPETPPPTQTPSTPAPAGSKLSLFRSDTGQVFATPATRRIARENNVDLENVQGSGKAGRVTKGDILGFVAQKSASVAPAQESAVPKAPQITEPFKLSPIKKAMFKAMGATLTVPHFSYSDSIDVTALEKIRVSLGSKIPLEYRKTLNAKQVLEMNKLSAWGKTRVADAGRFDKLTMMPLLLKALSKSMEMHPLFTCMLATDDNGEPLLSRTSEHDISIAFAAPSGGLYTPRLPAINKKSIFDIASEMAIIAGSASPTSTTVNFPTQHRGAGTVTLSNIGVVGGRTTHPIIPPTGQLAIGAIGQTRVVPMYADHCVDLARKIAIGNEMDHPDTLQIVPRLMMDATFSADHRVVEGIELARFVQTWKEIVQEPERLLV